MHPRALPRALGLALSLAFILATPALAQTYAPTVNASPDLGVIVPGSAPTTFSIASSSGTVTQSGNAVRRGSGTTRAQVTTNCTGTGQSCAANIYVKIGAIGSPTGKAGALSNFNVTASSGTISSQSTSGGVLTFIIKPVSKQTDASFYIGADFPITESGSAGLFGSATSQFYVYVGTAANPSVGPSVTASATTQRGISIGGSSLAFAIVSLPATGTTTVTLGPGSDTVALTGGTSSVATGSALRAAYTVSGEVGQAITVTVDPTFTLNRDAGGGSITVTTNHTTLPTTIPGSAGALGTTPTFYVGGSFNITSSTVTGGYTGHFNVTAVYN